MNLIKYGIGLLFLLTISCNSDDGIDLRKDKVLVKEIATEYLENKKIYNEHSIIEYNRNAFVSKIKSKTNFTIPFDEYFNRVDEYVEKEVTQSFYYKKDSLIDKIVTETGSIKETKEFVYNDLNQLMSVEEANLTTNFRYDNKGMVDQIKVIKKNTNNLLSTQDITYDNKGNLYQLIFRNLYSSEDQYHLFLFELDDYQHSFVNTNINLSIQDEVRKNLKINHNDSFETILYNFQYIYKGKQAIKSFQNIRNNVSNYVHTNEVIETHGDFISFYYRTTTNLPSLHVYYNFY